MSKLGTQRVLYPPSGLIQRVLEGNVLFHPSKLPINSQ